MANAIGPTMIATMSGADTALKLVGVQTIQPTAGWEYAPAPFLAKSDIVLLQAITPGDGKYGMLYVDSTLQGQITIPVLSTASGGIMTHINISEPGHINTIHHPSGIIITLMYYTAA